MSLISAGSISLDSTFNGCKKGKREREGTGTQARELATYRKLAPNRKHIPVIFLIYNTAISLHIFKNIFSIFCHSFRYLNSFL
jgi:hypothetical protein